MMIITDGNMGGAGYNGWKHGKDGGNNGWNYEKMVITDRNMERWG
jgi:hypothetical protein